MASIGDTITLSGAIKTGSAPGQEQWTLDQGQQVKVLNTRSVNGQQYYDIQHIGGGTGWTLASGLDAAMPQATQPSQISSQANANQLNPTPNPALVAGKQANVLASMGGAVAQATNALTGAIADQQKATDQELAQEKKLQQEALKNLEQQTQPFRAQEETKGRAKYGTEQVLSDQKALLSELDQLLTEGNNLIKQQQEVTGLASVRNPRVQQTMDDVLARAGVIEAVVNLQNTYLANAYNAIDRTVGAIAGDRQDQIAYYSSVLDMHNNNVINLSAEKKQLAQQQISILQYNLEQGVTSANYIKELMTNKDTAVMMAKAGVTLNDNIETINKKMADYQVTDDIREQSNRFTEAGAVSVFDPSTVPADQLGSFTDMNGKTHYFKFPATASGSATEEAAVDAYINWLKQQQQQQQGNNQPNGLPDVAAPENKPMFTPMNLNHVYTDPMTGKAWIFKQNGWEVLYE